MVDYDEVLWTELEFLRLHASILRTLSSTENVGGGRAEVKKKGAPPPLPHAADALDLRARIDALQRKALRMLHRAQLEARAGGGAGGPSPWPGVDPDTPDAEALADCYVSSADDASGAGGVAGDGDEDGDAALVDAQRPVQEALTGEMLALVGRLKRNVQGMADDLVTDAAVLDATDAAVDANLSGVVRQRGTLASYAKRATLSWWTGLGGLAVALGVFLFVYLFVIKLPW
ncbi:hypothetical protein I4F81_012108 [Pyropia yezoensis]|uniref:Uncharacterized protein n=1 Tax=Pyropia yezoensis TaxID=2788 RepID=A0ACC3CID6_PYRYE|nr:hypothetical protein I4F81_012108 [Neopyropia yezoensis]